MTSQEILIDALLECCRQQYSALQSGEVATAEAIDLLERLELVRSDLVHRVDWCALEVSDSTFTKLQELESLNSYNERQMRACRDRLEREIGVLKQRRKVSNSYYSNS